MRWAAGTAIVMLAMVAAAAGISVSQIANAGRSVRVAVMGARCHVGMSHGRCMVPGMVAYCRYVCHMTLFPMLSEMLEGDHYDVPKTQAKMTKAFIRPYTRRSAQPARKGFSAAAPSYAVPPAVRRLHSSTCGSK
jgi:hypothetical protein